MNVIMVMSGGVGNRYNHTLPKQYDEIRGRLIIDYVLEAAASSKLADATVVVIDEQYIGLSPMLSAGGYTFAPNGRERLYSVQNGFKRIAECFDCDKVVILDAVAPLVTGELIDEYFEKLDEYDAVITAQKLTGALGNLNFDPLDREQYYMTQSPEGFLFKKIYKVLDTEAKTQELAWQLGRDAKFYLNFDFKHNHKLTYDFEKPMLENMMEHYGILK